MNRPTEEVNMAPEISAEARDDREVVDDGSGQRDLMMGMAVGCVMAFGAIALAIIFSIT
jgi:hypothetical protein